VGAGGFEALFFGEFAQLESCLRDVDEDATRAVEDAFVQACAQWRRVSKHKNPAGWVRRRAVNRLLNVKRSGARFEVERDDATDARRDVRGALRRLPAQQRIIVALSFGRGLTSREVASAVRVSEGTVKHHLDTARVSLGLLLGVPEHTSPAEIDALLGPVFRDQLPSDEDLARILRTITARGRRSRLTRRARGFAVGVVVVGGLVGAFALLTSPEPSGAQARPSKAADASRRTRATTPVSTVVTEPEFAPPTTAAPTSLAGPSNLDATLTIDGSEVTVGTPVHFVATISNPHDLPVKSYLAYGLVIAVRFEDPENNLAAFPQVDATDWPSSLDLGPGEKRTVRGTVLLRTGQGWAGGPAKLALGVRMSLGSANVFGTPVPVTVVAP
jgi:RNA polymerase sigma-70 factor (ECF subfamily)